MLDISKFESVSNVHSASPDVSDRYSFVPTKRVLDVLGDFGWYPSKVIESGVRHDEKRGFQKHLIRLGNEQFKQLIRGREYYPEIVLKNAHDLTSVFELSLGIWRLVCENGMCAPESYGMQKIRHVGFAVEKVEDAVKVLMNFTPRLLDSVETFQSVQLSEVEQIAFSKAAIELKYDTSDATFKIEPQVINEARRGADKGGDLWTTFNRVQENLIKGGKYGKNEKGRWRKDREVKAINRNVDLNRALWTLAEEMAAIKTGTRI